MLSSNVPCKKKNKRSVFLVSAQKATLSLAFHAYFRFRVKHRLDIVVVQVANM